MTQRMGALVITSLLILAPITHAENSENKTMTEEPSAPTEVLNVQDANVSKVDAGGVIPISQLDDGVDTDALLNPNDPTWQSLTESAIAIGPAPALHRSVELRVDYTAPAGTAYVSMAKTNDRVFIRLRWDDTTQDVISKSHRFRDGAAIEFSHGDKTSNYMMGGSAEDTVNIWYWRADNNDFQNLAAGGPGSTTLLDEQPVTGKAGYYKSNSGENQWAVVMTRDIASSGEHNVVFDREQIPVAFAFWQGAQGQRDGLKSVTYGWYEAKPQ